MAFGGRKTCSMRYSIASEAMRPKAQIPLSSSRHVSTQHVTTHIDLSSVYRALLRACRAVLFDKLDAAKMHGLDTVTLSVSCRGETWRDEPSGIWAYGGKRVRILLLSLLRIVIKYRARVYNVRCLVTWRQRRIYMAKHHAWTVVSILFYVAWLEVNKSNGDKCLVHLAHWRFAVLRRT